MASIETPPTDARGADHDAHPEPAVLLVSDAPTRSLAPLRAALASHGLTSSAVAPRPWILEHSGTVLLLLAPAAEADVEDDPLHALRALEARPSGVLNRPSSLQVAHHRLLAARALEDADVPHVRTLACFEPWASQDIADAIGYPIVVRPVYGHPGRSAVRAGDPGLLLDAVGRLRLAAGVRRWGLAVQEHVSVLADVHVLVVEGQAVAARMRPARRGGGAALQTDVTGPIVSSVACR